MSEQVINRTVIPLTGWFEWVVKLFFLCGILFIAAFTYVAKLYYEGGAINISPSIEQMELRCQEMEHIKEQAIVNSLALDPKGKNKR